MLSKRAKHGMDGTPTYKAWISAKARCFNPKDKDYARYGGRGITICERWFQFENFIADMGVRPEGRSLDRINVDGNYEPDNCRWATPRQQRVNRRIISKTGVPGVNLERGRYRARILASGKYLHLGIFDNLDAAKSARAAAEKEHWDDSYS